MLKNSKEISQELFGGKISPWQVLYYARKGIFPYISVGRRRFFNSSEVLQAIHENACFPKRRFDDE